MSDRDECYHRVKACMAAVVVAYYRQFPERQFDERCFDGLRYSYDGLNEILTVLEDYEITKRLP